MTQNGKIISLTNGIAIIEVVRHGACGDGCSMCGACKTEPIRIEANCKIPVDAGDIVELETDSGAVMTGLAAVFVLPILLPLIAFVVGNQAWGVTVGGILAGTALALTVSLIVFFEKSSVFAKKTMPTVIRRIQR